jgi:twinkle protein
MKRDSTFTHNGPCASCGSSNANANYDDGHTYCFKCHTHKQGGTTPIKTEDRSAKTPIPMLPSGEPTAIKKRGLDQGTTAKFGYWCGKDNNGVPCQVADYRDENGDLIAQHVRYAGKEFSWKGRPSDVGLWGRHLWRDSGKMVVITEGEIDAMSVSQLQDNKWPVVSLPNGAQSAVKFIQRDLEWLEKFERVVLMLDNDEPGREAARACAEILSPGKAFIASLPLKDANDMLLAGRGSEIKDAIWGAKPFRPDGIVAGTDLWEKIISPPVFNAVEYPYPGLEAILLGVRSGEIVTITAGSGVGKSEFARSIVHHIHQSSPEEKIGILALEESTRRTAIGMLGLELGRRLHLSKDSLDTPEVRDAFLRTVGSGRVFLYDHFGSTASENLIARIRYMVRGLGCGTILLDHLSIVVSGQMTDDERRTIDQTMTNLRTLVEETGCRMLLVNHLKRVEGTAHEEGGRVRLSDLRGSAGIGQLSDIVIGLERNAQDKEKANITGVRILKNRFSGDQGIACFLQYDKTTGRMTEVPDPDDGGASAFTTEEV